MIDKGRRDSHLEQIDREMEVFERLFLESAGLADRPEDLNVENVFALIQPFAEWPFLNRDQKRRVLGSFSSEIKVRRYEINALQVVLPRVSNSCYDATRPKTAA